MEQIVRVALDAMGGDNAPAEIIKGAVAEPVPPSQPVPPPMPAA